MQKEETIPKLLENRGGTVYTIVKRTSVTAGSLFMRKALRIFLYVRKLGRKSGKRGYGYDNTEQTGLDCWTVHPGTASGGR